MALMRGYVRLPGTSKRVRTPSGATISDRAYNRLVNERKILAGKRVKSQRAKAIKQSLKKQGRLLPTRLPHGKAARTREGLKKIMDAGYGVKMFVGRGNTMTFRIWNALAEFLDKYKGKGGKLNYVPEFVPPDPFDESDEGQELQPDPFDESD